MVPQRAARYNIRTVTVGTPLPDISVIIPTLNESERLATTLSSLGNTVGVETLVVDGGSRDNTADIAFSLGAKVVSSVSGRARQMNAGASVARGRVLLFLHADTRLPDGYANHVRGTMGQPEVVAGAFQLRIDDSSPTLRAVERIAGWRSQYLQLPYGDQAIFIRADLFHALGGFLDLPIMEDFELVCRLRKQGRISIVPAAATTSARRWKQLGTWQTTLINQVLVVAYCLGVDPTRLARWYHRNGA